MVFCRFFGEAILFFAGRFLIPGGNLAPVLADQPLRVLNGIDMLRRQGLAPLAGKKVGLITDHTGLAAALEAALVPGVRFVPPHHARGQHESWAKMRRRAYGSGSTGAL